MTFLEVRAEQKVNSTEMSFSLNVQSDRKTKSEIHKGGMGEEGERKEKKQRDTKFHKSIKSETCSINGFERMNPSSFHL